jgi:pre-mRNA-processing factor 19
MLKCELSGQEPPEHPVITRTGHVFEKRLIEKHLETSDKCPISGEPLSVQELIEIKVGPIVRPRPAKATSIPSMLNLFQNEWDAVMLECFSLREQLHAVRQELAHALYQQDAACRVIARLVKERDEARRQLATAQGQPSTTEAKAQQEDAMEVEAGKGLNEQILQRLTSHSKKLTSERKKRVIPKETATLDSIKKYRQVSSHSVHSASKPGVLCLDMHPTRQELVLTGGVDKNVVLFNRAEEKVVCTLSGHTKRVSDVVFHPQQDVLLSASHDKTVRIWTSSSADVTKFSSTHCIRNHEGEVSSVTLHPIGDYFVSASLDSSWAFVDLQTARTLAQVRADEPDAIQTAQFHPDGMILATGTSEARIKVWDMKSLANVASFEGHKGKVTGISFSENGYFMASTADDSMVKLWDLRKLKLFQTINLEPAHTTCVSFDFSGSYLAVGGDAIRLYAFGSDKLLELATRLSDNTDTVTDVKFGQHANFLASTSLDRTLRFFSFE